MLKLLDARANARARFIHPFSFCVIMACCLGLMTHSVSAQNAVADQLVKLEKQALDRVGNKHLDALLTPVAAAPPKGLSYSKAWLDKQPKATGDAQWRCLSEALYFEARGETVRGQFAVAEVIMNRVASSAYPNSICRVINQGTGRKYACQFTYTCDGHPEVIHEKKAWARVGKVARAILDGAPRDLTKGAMYYHTKSVRPSWARKFQKTATIGVHYFYKNG